MEWDVSHFAPSDRKEMTPVLRDVFAAVRRYASRPDPRVASANAIALSRRGIAFAVFGPYDGIEHPARWRFTRAY
ncbi:hypothetical protein D9M69_623220 [compost metagenome]